MVEIPLNFYFVPVVVFVVVLEVEDLPRRKLVFAEDQLLGVVENKLLSLPNSGCEHIFFSIITYRLPIYS